jgi:hypothetical protein
MKNSLMLQIHNLGEHFSDGCPGEKVICIGMKLLHNIAMQHPQHGTLLHNIAHRPTA